MSSPKPSKTARRISSILHSIRFRLVLWFTAILALVLIVFSAFIYVNQTRDILGESVFSLDRKMAALGVTLTVTPDGILVPPGVLQDTDVLVFTDPNGQVLASHGPLPAKDAQTLADRAMQEYQQRLNSSGSVVSWMEGTGSPRTNYVFVTVPLQSGFRRNGLVILGSPADPYRLETRLLFTLTAGSLATLIIALLGGYWLADRAMRPVHTITQAARTIGETDLSRRLNMKSKDELGELANTFDGMLERLQAAFERQRQFVADASHELRTPLTIVNLETSRTLASLRKPEEYRQALSIIHSENDFMTALVNDLLTLARMDAGQAVMESQPIDLSDVAVETIERLTPLAVRNSVRLEAGDLPEAHILGDRQHLIQMVSNLVDNGIKYAAGDHKKVSIETGSTGETAWVRISDNGPGIAPEHLPHLFDRFYRIDQSRTRAGDDSTDSKTPGGSGLGLSIVQWIAQSHHGEIKVDSLVGTGTTFEVRFKAI
jgi:signal transduction histidine kinase